MKAIWVILLLLPSMVGANNLIYEKMGVLSQDYDDEITTNEFDTYSLQIGGGDLIELEIETQSGDVIVTFIDERFPYSPKDIVALHNENHTPMELSFLYTTLNGYGIFSYNAYEDLSGQLLIFPQSDFQGTLHYTLRSSIALDLLYTNLPMYILPVILFSATILIWKIIGNKQNSQKLSL